jgi:hypothetical protein
LRHHVLDGKRFDDLIPIADALRDFAVAAVVTLDL